MTTILIMDDIPANRYLLESVLKGNGFGPGRGTAFRFTLSPGRDGHTDKDNNG